MCESLQGGWCDAQPTGVHAVLYRFLLRVLQFPCQELRKQVHAFFCEQLRLSPCKLTNSTLAVLHHLSGCEKPGVAAGGAPFCVACKNRKHPFAAAGKTSSAVEQTVDGTAAVLADASAPFSAARSAADGPALHCSATACRAAPTTPATNATSSLPLITAATAPSSALADSSEVFPQQRVLFHPSRHVEPLFGLVDAAGSLSPFVPPVQSVAAHSLLLSLGELVKTLEPPSRLSAVFPLLLRLSEEPAVPPVVIMHVLQRLVRAVLSSNSSSSVLEAQQQWETGMQVLAVCRQVRTRRVNIQSCV